MRNFILLSIAAGAWMTSACNNEKSTNNTTTADHDHSAHAHTSEQQYTTAQPATKPQQAPVEEPTAEIPEFKFYKLKSGFSFEKTDVPQNGKNTVFIFFDPSCNHCQIETQHLSENYSKLKDVNLLFVSMNDPGLMANFLPTFGKGLIDKPNVELLYDRDQEFIRKIHVPSMFPANYVYGPDGKLKTFWVGAKEFDDVLAAILK